MLPGGSSREMASGKDDGVDVGVTDVTKYWTEGTWAVCEHV